MEYAGINIKSISVIVVFSLLFTAVSCANSHTVILSDNAGETLRSQSDRKNKEILWTRELESMRLVQDITHEDSVDKAVKLTPQTVVVSAAQAQPVYPFIDGFGSLDTSLITRDVRNVLDTFCKNVSTGLSADPCMADGCLYSYVLFADDLKNGWKSSFGEDIPEGSENSPLFTKMIYGAPFIDDADYEIPVRFECSKGYVDILLYFEKTGSEYKINQIEIQKWGKANGQ
jgi:hypothetical protein